MASTTFAMDFEHSKNTSYMDALDSNFTNYLDSGMDYLQPYPPSPAYGVAIGLPAQSDSPLSFTNLNLPTTVGDYTYSSSPARPYTPPDGASLSPPQLSYTLSAGELSSDGMPSSGRHSRGSDRHSPPAIPYAATVPRSHRFNPIMAPATRASTRAAHRRRSSRSNDDSDDEDEEFQPTSLNAGTDSRRETIRKQRIESEQRRRDELRDGYARLKETLPPSNQKSSKVSLLDRATSHLRYLDTVREQLEARLKAAEQEVHRLRNVNEALMLGTARHNVPATSVPASF
ncbi:putative helix loop helix domain containing protein [Lyophyllum shimeji]|uniref:Helix loop helix domain containing protein n=1 Tax=Lyophyllum shimeji TaxID=47721 RepID=A0A9P3ULV2_LYOSH|nr:putative helix loop helix domain containing protein [Lyophyllum shimeji]